MRTAELPMILFTTIAQMSVGAFWVLGIIMLLGRRRGVSENTIARVTRAGMYVAGPLLVLGFFAAFFHLGYPLHAPFTFLGLGHSPLSAEITFGVLYGVAGLILACLEWFHKGGAWRRAFWIITAAVGLGLIISMVIVYYTVVTVPAWHSWFTWVLFFGSTFFTGALADALAITVAWFHHRREDDAASPEPAVAPEPASSAEPAVAPHESDAKEAGPGFWHRVGATMRRGLFPGGPLTDQLTSFSVYATRFAVALSAAAGIILLLAYPFQMARLGINGGVETEVASNMLSHGWLAIRLISLVIAIALIAFAARDEAYRTCTPTRKLVWILAIALVVVLASELLGRGLHYEGLIRVGINTFN